VVLVTPTAAARDGGPRAAGRTRTEILTQARRLFTEKGYEATTTQDIGDALGITKPALYYHFRNKEEIATTLLGGRRAELDELVAWLAAEPPAPDLLERAAARWIRTTTLETVELLRLAQANQPLMRRLRGSALDVRGAFDHVVVRFVPDGDPSERLLVRMAFDTVGAALLASHGDVPPVDVLVAGAERASRALARELDVLRAARATGA
jgi:AcrR family transcriptional regulator